MTKQSKIQNRKSKVELLKEIVPRRSRVTVFGLRPTRTMHKR